MPVSAQSSSNNSLANGVTTVFPYAFKIVAAADLLVQVAGFTKILNVDYTVSGVGNDAGGNVTFISGAPAAGALVTRKRNMAYSRSTDYQQNGDLLEGTLDADQDAPILMIQQLAEAIGNMGTAQGNTYLAYGLGTVPRTIADKLMELVSVKDYGAVGNGTLTDDAAAFALANSYDFIVPPGSYYIATNLVLSKLVTILPGAIITVAGGVTVSFNGGLVAAPGDQIFYGAGVVNGLRVAYADWFAGDKRNTANDALTELQKWLDSVVNAGQCLMGPGYYSITGVTALAITKGQEVLGAGSSNSAIAYTTAANNAFSISGGAVSPVLRGISIAGNNSAIVPVSGVGINVLCPYSKLSDIIIGSGFYGIAFQAGSSGSVIEDFQILDTMQAGLYVSNVNDVYARDFIITAPSDYLTFNAMSGDFQVGESVTFAGSGAVGTVSIKLSPTLYRMQFPTKIPTVGQVGTGGTSGKVGTLTVFNKSNALGGIRLAEFAEAIILVDGDVIGGNYPLTTTAAAYAIGVRPAYSHFTNVYFDSCKNGALIDRTSGMTFTGCWFSNRPTDGCNITAENESLTFNGCMFVNNWNHGCILNAGALHVKFIGCTFAGNNVSATGAHGLTVAAGATDFSVIGCRLGGTLGFGTQAYGLNINAGASDRYIVRDNNGQGNATGAILDGGTGVNKFVQGNIGFNPRGNLGPPGVAASTVAVNNPYGCDVMVYIAGGTISAVTVNGVATGIGVTNQGYFVPAGGSIAITYTVAPTWKWFGS